MTLTQAHAAIRRIKREADLRIARIRREASRRAARLRDAWLFGKR